MTRTVNWCPLALVIVEETDEMREHGHAGYQRRWCAHIHPDYADDAGLLAHELTHVRQWWRRPLSHGKRYARSEVYRLNAEVEAFRAQLAAYPAEHRDYYLDRLAHRLATYYGFGLTPDEAAEALR